MIVTENSSGVAVGERNLDRVVADGRGGLGARLGLEHGQGGGRSGTRAGKGALSYPLVIASGAGALVAKIGKIVVTRMTVGPGNVDARAAAYMNLYRGGLLTGINGYGHRV